MKKNIKTYIYLTFFFVSFSIYSQDTIKLNNVTVSNFNHNKIKKEIKKKFKKNFKFSNYNYNINLKSNDGKNNIIININENNLSNLDKFIYENKIPENIKLKINNNYFEDIDDFNSPVYLLTIARFKYIKINDYIKNIEINTIDFLDDKKKILKINSEYKDYNIVITLNYKTFNVLSIEFKLKEKTKKKSIRKTTGTTNYLNSESSFDLLNESIKFDFEEVNNELYLINYENNIIITNYIVKIYEQNKTNKLILNKIYNFNTENYIRKEK